MSERQEWGMNANSTGHYLQQLDTERLGILGLANLQLGSAFTSLLRWYTLSVFRIIDLSSETDGWVVTMMNWTAREMILFT